ncbi:Repressible high-affinity phosphate permease [Sphaceloma murrayae]|uniref:Repressible high-affinity phosphate permease n=1 Tax=Sphaceloma murrayae TaxID=2082308 RepID=A0A2K1QR53_9PEZI|nr:Repressible high-affinity phosphate permease [Sphaceloma murrayae]
MAFENPKTPVPGTLEKVAIPEIDDVTKSLAADNAEEHELTLRVVARQHPKIILWSFFWCMCAVGWGFDTQVNGAMVSIPTFRGYYGYYLDGKAVLGADWQAAFNVVSSAGQFFGGFACSWISDRTGRRFSLAIGVLICSAMAFVLLGEVSSLALRARTTALATATQAVFGIVMFFAVPFMVNPDEANLRGKVGFIFGGMSAVATVACIFFIPELKGRTISEIDTMFYRQVPLRKMGTYKIDEVLS